MQPTSKKIYLLSDGTGETAERVLRSGLKQFNGYNTQVQKFPYVTDVTQLQKVIQLTAEDDALLIFTLVDPGLRQEAKELAGQQRIRHIDLLDNVLNQLSLYFRANPIGVPNQMNLVNDEYFKRIEAVEFTVRGDDGKNPKLLHKADIILVGVSRTSKTPLSVFLAHKGYKVCNIPIVLDRPLPKALFEIDQNSIFALTIDPDVLQQIRKQRLKTLMVSNRSSYSDIEHIWAELDWADQMYRRNPTWPVIDVTKRAVEETSSIILQAMADRGLAHSHTEIGQL
jgi:regulator of PEP synthase PpsR (kinase-PPPase family)